MSNVAIKTVDISKKYQIHHNVGYYRTLREEFGKRFRSPFLRKAELPATVEEFWALRNINVEIKHGEFVGIVGSNGAGKSTLLKILSRIVQPTTGYAKIYGRIGSLLEVGTGFHPELTGRENVFLSGAVLGMSRQHIRQHFDEIVAFAEVEQFLDTPVKHFSSGMYMRLAFSVAAHLEPEIMIVDEVLSVGDSQFQKRSLEKMDDVGKSGRTILFVSHNLTAIKNSCTRAVLLNKGQIIRDGIPSQVIDDYAGTDLTLEPQHTWEKPVGNDIARLYAARVCTEAGRTEKNCDIRQPIGIEMEYEVLKPGHILVAHCHLSTESGAYVFGSNDVQSEWSSRPRPPGRYTSTAWVPGNLMSEGKFVVGVELSTLSPVQTHFSDQHALSFQVIDPQEGGSARGNYRGEFPGLVRPMLTWTHNASVKV